MRLRCKYWTRIIACMFLTLCSFSSFAYKVEDIPNVHLKDRTRFLSNPDNVISRGVQDLSDSIMQRIWQNTSAEVIAVVVDSIADDNDPDNFATELFELWGVGKSDRDNGLLLLVSVKDRAAVIRTGYGMEGVLPDIVAGKIIREKMFPYFRQGEYDRGLLSGLSELSRVITDPEYSEELKSKYANDAGSGADDDFGLQQYFILAVIAAIVLLLYVLFIKVNYNKEPQKQWDKLSKGKMPALMVTIFFLGIPIVGYLLLLAFLKRLRNTPPECPRCKVKMKRLPKGDDERWLSSGNLTERRIKSMEHDVWECPSCGYGLVKSFKNPHTTYTTCEKCESVAKHMVSDTILKQPTTYSKGIGERVYRCEHCGNENHTRYEIPRKVPVVIVPGGGHGGGGFSGGSFGGGHTGGGGASGRW